VVSTTIRANGSIRSLPGGCSARRAPIIWSRQTLQSASIAHCRGAKLIFVLRNPIDRAYSNYLWSRQNGLENETFEDALALEEQRERDLTPQMRFARPHAYFSRGLYAEHLARFFARFPRKQILVLQHEDIVSRPGAIAAAFQRFVGVAEIPGLARDLGPINAVKAPPLELVPKDLRRRLAERYSAANAKLQTLLGSNFDTWNAD
jgi:hypothetical protein